MRALKTDFPSDFHILENASILDTFANFLLLLQESRYDNIDTAGPPSLWGNDMSISCVKGKGKGKLIPYAVN